MTSSLISNGLICDYKSSFFYRNRLAFNFEGFEIFLSCEAFVVRQSGTSNKGRMFPMLSKRHSWRTRFLLAIRISSSNRRLSYELDIFLSLPFRCLFDGVSKCFRVLWCLFQYSIELRKVVQMTPPPKNKTTLRYVVGAWGPMTASFGPICLSTYLLFVPKITLHKHLAMATNIESW